MEKETKYVEVVIRMKIEVDPGADMKEVMDNIEADCYLGSRDANILEQEVIGTEVVEP